MDAIVLVHGINHQQQGAAAIEDEVLPYLVSGIENAAKQQTEDLRTRAEALAKRLRDGSVKVRAAFYGDFFLKPRFESDAEKDFGDSLAKAWMKTASERATRERTRESAAQELRELDAQGQAQGRGRVLGWAIERIGHVPGMADWVMGGVAMLEPALSQVTRYMREPKVRQMARDEVHRLITPDTRVLIGHSLGSVIAYDVARAFQQGLPLLMTLGSPLGLKEIIYNRLDPQPPTFPPKVERWVNIADREDFIASTLDLRPLFSAGQPAEARFDNDASVNNEKAPHALLRYLAKKVTGSALLEALTPHL